MNEYNENNQIKEEMVTMQDLPEQRGLNQMNASGIVQPEKKEEKKEENKSNTLVKVLILIIIILLLLNACSIYHFKKEINHIEENCEATCSSKYQLPGDADKDITSPDGCRNPDDDKNNDDDNVNPGDDTNNNPDNNKNPDENRYPQVDNRVFKVKFANPRVKEGSMQGNINISDGSTALSFNSELNIPGDYFTFYVDVVNTGEVNAKIGSYPVKSSLTPDQSRYLAYEVRYADGSEVRENDTLAIGETKTLEFKIEFMREITVDDLPKQEETINFTYELTYVEK